MSLETDLTDEDVESQAHEYYTSFYDNPRPIGYNRLAKKANGDIQLADFYSDCIDLGISDQENDLPKRSKTEVVFTVLGRYE